MYELWVMLVCSSGEEEELLGRIERWKRREREIDLLLLLLFDGVVYIILVGCI